VSDERKSSVRNSLEGVRREAVAIARQATLIYRDVRGSRPMWVRADRDVVMLVHGLFATAVCCDRCGVTSKPAPARTPPSFTHPPGPRHSEHRA